MCKSSLHRECLQCGTTFEVSKYNSAQKYCGPNCRAAAWRDNNRETFNARHKGYNLKANYGITVEDRDAMYAAQEGKCKVCNIGMTFDNDSKTKVCVDHCHTTGEVHGLLCARCNKAAGLLGENPEITAKLTAYLLDTGKVPTR